MSRFDLFAAGQGGGYLLDLQADILEHYNTRVVAPVVPADSYDGAAKGLNPTVTVEGTDYVVQTHLLAAIPAAALKQRVATLEAQRDEITRALDLLFQGH